MLASNTLTVSTIKDGTVIDHIVAGQGLKLVRMLRLDRHRKRVSMGMHLPSPSMGTKDLIKIEDRELSCDEANQVAILAPDATISIIQGHEVTKKFTVVLPDTIEKVIVCPNPRCITNDESAATLFNVHQRGRVVQLQCRYCQKTFSQEDIRKYNT